MGKYVHSSTGRAGRVPSLRARPGRRPVVGPGPGRGGWGGWAGPPFFQPALLSSPPSQHPRVPPSPFHLLCPSPRLRLPPSPLPRPPPLATGSGASPARPWPTPPRIRLQIMAAYFEAAKDQIKKETKKTAACKCCNTMAAGYHKDGSGQLTAGLGWRGVGLSARMVSRQGPGGRAAGLQICT